MTNLPTPERGTLFDLPFENARDRISSLHASATPGTRSRQAPDPGRPAPLRRLRSAIGMRLVDIGSALLAEESAPRATRS